MHCLHTEIKASSLKILLAYFDSRLVPTTYSRHVNYMTSCLENNWSLLHFSFLFASANISLPFSVPNVKHACKSLRGAMKKSRSKGGIFIKRDKYVSSCDVFDKFHSRAFSFFVNAILISCLCTLETFIYAFTSANARKNIQNARNAQEYMKIYPKFFQWRYLFTLIVITPEERWKESKYVWVI